MNISKKHLMIAGILGIIICLCIVCLGAVAYRLFFNAPASISNNDTVSDKTNENDTEVGSAESDQTSILALDIGFYDDEVKKADSEGARFISLYESNVDNIPYTAFFLSKEYEPRVLNDYATIILVYEGTTENIGNFVHRIEVKDALDAEGIASLFTARTLSEEVLPFTSPVLTAYKVAGFSYLSRYQSVIVNETYYDALVFGFQDSFYALTFETLGNSSSAEFLHRFKLNYGSTDAAINDLPEFSGGYENISNGYARVSSFSPTSKNEKALFAIGCFPFEVYDSNGSSTPYNKYGETLSYNGYEYSFYSCPWRPNIGYPGDLAFSDSYIYFHDTFIAVFKSKDGEESMLYNGFYSTGETNSGIYDVVFGDTNYDAVPDLRIDKMDYYWGGSGGSAPGGFDLWQFTTDGNLIDLFSGIEVTPVLRGNIYFEDINQDGVAELIESSPIAQEGEPAVGWGMYQEIRSIYELKDDFYYVHVGNGFDIACIEAIEELPNDMARYGIYELFAERFSANSDHMFYYHQAVASLSVCDVVGVSEGNRENFLSLISTKFPDSCSGFYTGIEMLWQLRETGEFMPPAHMKSFPDLSYWKDVFSGQDVCY